MKMYRDYKTLKFEFFKRDLEESLENHTTYYYLCFQNIFMTLLNKLSSASNMLRKLQEWASRMNICLAIKNASFICCKLCVVNFEYPNLYKFKYSSSAFAVDYNSSISYWDYFIFHKTVSLFVTILV